MKEKRKFTRLPTHHLIKYRILEKEKAFSFARNISAGGLLFYCKEKIPIGSIVEIIINFPGRQGPVKVLAKISRISVMKRIGGFEAAARYVNIDDEAREFIDKKILKVMKKIDDR